MTDNDPPSSSGSLPPLLPSGSLAGPPEPSARPLGEEPTDREPIAGVFGAVEAILRQPRRIVYALHCGENGSLIWGLLVIAVSCALVYGLVVGTFSGNVQLWAAPLKVAGGLLVSALICLPSLYIFSCLSGARARLGEVFGLVVGLLALMTVLLVGFAPVAWVFSQSTQSLPAMGSLHLIFWAIATYFGVRFLSHGFSHLGGKGAGLRVWTLIFVLVMMQMTSTLRPLVGTADTFLPPASEKKFFLTHWLEHLKK